jgi:hypothetical protein
MTSRSLGVICNDIRKAYEKIKKANWDYSTVIANVAVVPG